MIPYFLIDANINDFKTCAFLNINKFSFLAMLGKFIYKNVLSFVIQYNKSIFIKKT